MKYFNLLFCILLILFCSCSSKNDPEPTPEYPSNNTKVGTAPYAIQHPRFDCETYLQSIKQMPGYNISWLWNTFGNERACLERLVNDPKLNAIELHLMNEVCVRNGNCGSYEILSGMSKSRVNELAEREEGWFRQRIVEYSNGAAAYIADIKGRRPDVSCYISPGLESNMTKKAMTNVTEWLRPMFPWCQFVFNPVHDTGERVEGSHIEDHNPYRVLNSPCIFNTDGYSITFPEWGSLYPRNISHEQIPEVLGKFKSCDIIFYWHHSYNCINPRQFIDPRARACDETIPFTLLGRELGKLYGH